MYKKHKGFTVVQLVIAMVIFAILTGIGITGYQQHARRADVETASNDLRIFGNNYEDAVADIGYVFWEKGATDAKEKVKEYLKELQEVYMNCEFNIDERLEFVDFGTDHYGFTVDMKEEKDPWGLMYRMVYIINQNTGKADNIYFASAGPNSTWVEYIEGSNTYLSEKYDDDIILAMTVREINK